MDDKRLPGAIEIVLYRVLQEALTNVLKYARATQVSLIVEQRHDQVQLIVEDDGEGFDLETVQHPANSDRRLGLLGMRERVAIVGGNVQIETAVGVGTTIYVRIPLPPDRPPTTEE
jgi:signal transduction histidine kinase